MDSNTENLKNYIDAQRAAGTTDEVIYSTLISNGWQEALVAQALSAQVSATQPPTTVEQPAQTPAVDTKKNIKKVKVIGIITIVLGAVAILGSVQFGIDRLQLILGVAEIIIGIGLLFLNKIAYTFFNVLAILAILSSIVLLPTLALVIFFVISSPFIEVMLVAAITLVLTLGQLGFYIYGGIALHNKQVRALFHTKR